jgi:selenocysteine lyase/cysteine desulfurase
LGFGTSGVLIFNKKLYQNLVPDNPGGGSLGPIRGEHKFIDNIEDREDGGTPDS